MAWNGVYSLPVDSVALPLLCTQIALLVRHANGLRIEIKKLEWRLKPIAPHDLDDQSTRVNLDGCGVLLLLLLSFLASARQFRPQPSLFRLRFQKRSGHVATNSIHGFATPSGRAPLNACKQKHHVLFLHTYATNSASRALARFHRLA